jgi:hypothetical protein
MTPEAITACKAGRRPGNYLFDFRSNEGDPPPHLPPGSGWLLVKGRSGGANTRASRQIAGDPVLYNVSQARGAYSLLGHKMVAGIPSKAAALV